MQSNFLECIFFLSQQYDGVKSTLTETLTEYSLVQIFDRLEAFETG